MDEKQSYIKGIKDIRLLGFEYQSVGDIKLLMFLNKEIFISVGRVFSIFDKYIINFYDILKKQKEKKNG